MNQVISFFSEVRGELEKIVWPTKEQTTRYTILVLIVAVATGLFLGGLDYILTAFTNFLVLR